MNHAKKKRKRQLPTRSGTIGRVRLPGERNARLVYEGDPDQRPVVHERVEDVLDRMLRKGEIGSHQFNGGRAFEEHFRRAQMTGYSLSRMDGMAGISGGSRANLTNAQLIARSRVFEALGRLGQGGGTVSQTASVAWYVIGVGETLNRWSARQQCNGRAMRSDVAKGVLIAALDVLAAYFGFIHK